MASGDLISKVINALNEEKVRPLTDTVVVQSAEIIHYEVSVWVAVQRGVGRSEVKQAIISSLQQYAREQNRFRGRISLEGFIAAVFRPGVELIDEISDYCTINADWNQVPVNTDISVLVRSIDDDSFNYE